MSLWRGGEQRKKGQEQSVTCGAGHARRSASELPFVGDLAHRALGAVRGTGEGREGAALARRARGGLHELCGRASGALRARALAREGRCRSHGALQQQRTTRTRSIRSGSKAVEIRAVSTESRRGWQQASDEGNRLPARTPRSRCWRRSCPAGTACTWSRRRGTRTCRRCTVCVAATTNEPRRRREEERRGEPKKSTTN